MIEIRQLQKVVDGRTVLDIDALEVGTGEIAAISGAPGSGKSVLLDLLIGRSTPTAGSIYVAGLAPASDQEQLNTHIGVLFAENGLYERLSAKANLEFFCRLRALSRGRAAETLAQVGLSDHAHVPVDRLPKALLRRLAFGHAILHRPAVLLLVEPFADADAASAALLSDLMQTFADNGTTILLLVTDATRLAGLCDQVYQLDHGRLSPLRSARDTPQTERPFKIPARLEGKVALVNPVDILYISVEDGRTHLYTADGPIASHLTLGELEQRLDRGGFFRAHRAYLVNLQHVKEVVSYTRNSFTLILDDPTGTRIPLSKASARELRELLGY